MGNNLYVDFLNLIPTESTEIVTIDSVDSVNGTSLATTLGGNQVTVKGTSIAVGSKAFVKAGEIIGQAPNLTIVEVTV